MVMLGGNFPLAQSLLGFEGEELEKWGSGGNGGISFPSIKGRTLSGLCILDLEADI